MATAYSARFLGLPLRLAARQIPNAEQSRVADVLAVSGGNPGLVGSQGRTPGAARGRDDDLGGRHELCRLVRRSKTLVLRPGRRSQDGYCCQQCPRGNNEPKQRPTSMVSPGHGSPRSTSEWLSLVRHQGKTLRLKCQHLCGTLIVSNRESPRLSLGWLLGKSRLRVVITGLTNRTIQEFWLTSGGDWRFHV